MGEIRKRKRRKKKSYKLAIWITLAILVILGGGGWGAYHYITHRDVQAADIGVEDDFFDFSAITDNSPATTSGGSVTSADPAGTTTGGGKNSSNTSTSGSTEGQGTGDSKAGSTGTTGASAGAGSQQAIEAKYSSVLKQLQQAALSKLDTLASNAVSDYKRGRSVTDISSTYLSAANKLQGAVDSAFATEVGRMRDDLKKSGYSPEAADQAQAAYAAAVSAKKSEMLSKARELVGK